MANERRRHFKIDQLPPDIKAQVDDMLAANFTYAEIVDYIQSETDMKISAMAVSRYAQNLQKSIMTLRMAQENFRVIMDEVSRYPSLDTSEGILRLLSHYILESIHNTPEEKWKELEPEQLIKQATSLVKAAAYKKNLDIKNEDIMSAGFEQVKTYVFELMAKEEPDMYEKFAAFLDRKAEDIK